MTEVEVVVHPAARRPVVAALVCLLLGMLGSAAWALAPPYVTVPLLALLAGSLLPFFLPTTCRLEPEWLTVRRAGRERRYPMARFRAFVRDRNGLFLSPYREAAPNEGMRGVFLALDPDAREQVESWLMAHGLERRGSRRG